MEQLCVSGLSVAWMAVVGSLKGLLTHGRVRCNVKSKLTVIVSGAVSARGAERQWRPWRAMSC